jgi:hypothetical protein
MTHYPTSVVELTGQLMGLVEDLTRSYNIFPPPQLLGHPEQGGSVAIVFEKKMT